MIKLNDQFFIGQGKNRVCYKHPHKDKVCIKITLPNAHRDYDENEKEYSYIKKLLKNKDIPLPIAKPLDWVETNFGRGLEYELIQDYDGKTSQTMDYVLNNNLLSVDEIIVEMERLKESFCRALLSPIEVSMVNILFQRTSATTYRLVFIDGYGLKNFHPIMYLSKALRRWQIRKRFDARINELRENRYVNCKSYLRAGGFPKDH